MWLFTIGIGIHIIFFMSVFDIYFRTPLIHGMVPQSYDISPPARRLVLFVADGLRADSFFELTNDSTKAPYLRTIIENVGTFGISHTRVPTESRPGHAALLGGIYEDPSAIAKGWKENPVEFDSVLNESFHTWSWGSPDILNSYSSASTNGHIESFTYHSYKEDFASRDASEVDSWVFDHVKDYFHESAYNKEVKNLLQEDQIFFFLHLLGIDTNGHSHKPQSQEYQSNIELVDKGVRDIVNLFENFYKDNSTAFIFTSDHGMTNWGSHGAGDPSETETPMVAWGAGVAGPRDSSNFQERLLYDPRIDAWELGHLRKYDIYQTDVAPLMSSLIGIPIPVNSVGTLPVDYLIPNGKYRAEALYANARQILQQFELKQKQKASNTLHFLYKPFPDLSDDKVAQMQTRIRNFMENSDFEEAIKASFELISLGLAGLNYYHSYDRVSLSLSITLGFVGWILLLICQILKDHTNIGRISRNPLDNRRLKTRSYIFASILLLWGTISIVLLVWQKSPWQHYFYFLTPVVLWGLVYLHRESFQYAWLILKSSNMVWELAIRILVTVVGLEILVFSFFIRPLLSIGLIGIGLWPLVLHSLEGSTEKSLQVCWIGSCILLASFTYLPVVGKDAVYGFVEIAGIVAFLLLAVGLCWCGGEFWAIKAVPIVFCIEGCFLLSSVYLVHSTAFSIHIKEGLPLANQIASWCLLGASFILPLLGSSYIMGRLVSLTAALLCPFILLSVRHEVFFYISLSVAMFMWLFLEYYLAGNNVQIAALKFAMWESSSSSNSATRMVDWSDIRRAFFFLFFVILAFFGIGNIASINSFDPRFVYCFVTVFSPFTMGGLLLLKIMIPFLLVTCFFQAICSLLEVPVKALFLLFLVLSDIMALHFFFLIKTEGSWLDMGTSISHYVICMATTVFLMALMQIAKVLTTFSVTCSLAKDEEEEILPRVNRRLHKD